jgi:GntR family transcriptional regulator
MTTADEVTADHLLLEAGSPVFLLRRLRLADAEPLAVEVSALIFKGCERLLEEDLEHNSLYQLLEHTYGIPLMEAEQEIEAGLAGPEDAETLQIPLGSPVLHTRRTTFTDRNRPIEYAQSVYCGTKYTFFTHLKRDRLLS